MTGRCSITAGPGGAVGRAVLRRHGRESNIGRKLTPGSRAFVKHHMATEDDSNLNSLLRITTFGYGPRGEPPIVRRARDSSGEPSSECAHAGGPGYRCRRDDISNDASSIHALPRRVALLLRCSGSCNNYLLPTPSYSTSARTVNGRHIFAMKIKDLPPILRRLKFGSQLVTETVLARGSIVSSEPPQDGRNYRRQHVWHLVPEDSGGTL